MFPIDYFSIKYGRGTVAACVYFCWLIVVNCVEKSIHCQDIFTGKTYLGSIGTKDYYQVPTRKETYKLLSVNMTELERDDAYMVLDDEDEEESDDFYGGSSDDEENMKPKKQIVVPHSKVVSKKPSKNTKTTKTSSFAAIAQSSIEMGNVLGSKENLSNLTSKATKVNQKEKTVEEKYQKKSQIEHILLRPDTYSKFLLIHFRIALFILKVSGVVIYLTCLTTSLFSIQKLDRRNH
jgi:hypothetical protein